jgi:hypothetical protein
MLVVFYNHGLGYYGTLTDYFLNFTIDSPLNLLTVRLSVLRIRKSNVAQLSIHTKLSHYVIGQVIGFL